MTGPIAKIAALVIVAAILVIAALGIGYLAIGKIDTMIAKAVQLKADERDAFWTGKIEKANADANTQIAKQATRTIQIQAEAADSVNTASQQLEELRKRNAALSNGGDRGLSADRAQLLPN